MADTKTVKNNDGRKPRRAMKKRVRKTIASVLLASAITVAAIPIPEGTAQAAATEPAVTPVTTQDGQAGHSIIPLISGTDTIYSTGDNKFQFAYKSTAEFGDVAVLVGYVATGLEGGQLTIPESLEAYVQYTTTEGTNRGLTAANQDGNPLFYKMIREVTVSRNGTVNDDSSISYGTWTQTNGAPFVETTGNAVNILPQLSDRQFSNDGKSFTETLKYFVFQFYPCLYENKETWRLDGVNYYIYDSVSSGGYGSDTFNYYRLPNDYNTLFASREITMDGIGLGTSNVNFFDAGVLDAASGTPGKYFTQATQEKRWLENVKVGCISNQRVKSVNGAYQLNPSADQYTGFFTNGANIRGISIPKSIFAIADYSFYGCSNLQSVEFGDSSLLSVIGESAFEDCVSMTSFILPSNTAVSTIAQKAFKNCQSLVGFTFPTEVDTICDKAFEGCTSLVNLDFSGALRMKKFGNDVFNNCSALEEVTLPDSLETVGRGTFRNCISLRTVVLPNNSNVRKLYFSDFQGDVNLEWIECTNENTSFDTSDYPYGVDEFKEEVGEDFYFIGKGSSSAIHENVTSKHAIAFMYKGTGVFEKIVTDEDNAAVTLTYTANQSGELLGIDIRGAGSYSAVIPGQIGPYAITAIGSEFSNNGAGNNNLTSVTIPKTVTRIGDGAFKGCKNLTTVYFEEPNSLSEGGIGTDAFKTQEGVSGGAAVPSLTFYGTIDPNSAPFVYAMNARNNINNANQTETYIDFCSGTPTNIHVMYNKETGKTMCWKVPTVDDAEYIKSVADAVKASPLFGTSDFPSGASDAALCSAARNLYDTSLRSLTPAVVEAVEAAYYITLPAGIQSFKNQMFSDATSSNTQSGTPTEKASVTAGITSNDELRSITMYDVEAVDAYAFYGCDKLESVMWYAGSSRSERLGDYAFGHCPDLTDVSLPTTLTTMGLRPFVADTYLTGLRFVTNDEGSGSSSGNNFSCYSGIIYGLNNDGSRKSLVECLESRNYMGNNGASVGSSRVDADDVSGISEIYEEAFMNCNGLGTVDLSSAKITTVPVWCFANDSRLTEVILNNGCNRISKYSFKDTGLARITMPSTVSIFEIPEAWYDTETTVQRDVEVTTSEGSAAENLAKNTYNIYGWTVGKNINPVYTVTFTDYDSSKGINLTIKEELVSSGDAATAPTEAEMAQSYAAHPDEYFVGWDRDFSNIGMNLLVNAKYEDVPPVSWTVKFVDWDLSVLATRTVLDGESAEEPKTPSRECYTFDGWIARPEDSELETMDMKNITGNVTYIASYKYNSSSENNSGSGSSTPAGTFNLTVVNGSGSGSYVAGTTVTVAAFTPNSGYKFYNWSASRADIVFTAPTLSANSFVMPAADVTVTANYIISGETGNNVTSAGTKGTVTNAASSNTGSTSGSKKDSSDSSSDKTTDNKTNSGSSVAVDRNGISNISVASATVIGSKDNFIVRVKEKGTATAAVAEALKNEYGDLSAIRYFAMDIELYDETGEKLITDTEGLSVTITLPIPDELRQYAGNNQVASVINGNKLEKLTPRFSTVDGVPCVTFTATHFSPYTIYADTGNLTSGVYDNTPKTGDGIHPKWFLAAGLALLSAALFMKRDKKVVTA